MHKHGSHWSRAETPLDEEESTEACWDSTLAKEVAAEVSQRARGQVLVITHEQTDYGVSSRLEDSLDSQLLKQINGKPAYTTDLRLLVWKAAFAFLNVTGLFWYVEGVILD